MSPKKLPKHKRSGRGSSVGIGRSPTPENPRRKKITKKKASKRRASPRAIDTVPLPEKPRPKITTKRKITMSIPNLEKDIRDLMISAAEVQIAGMNAGIGFWTSWVEEANNFSKSAADGLQKLKKNSGDDTNILLGIAEANQAFMRAMLELPRETARRFADELGSRGKGRSGSGKPRRRSAKAKP